MTCRIRFPTSSARRAFDPKMRPHASAHRRRRARAQLQDLQPRHGYDVQEDRDWRRSERRRRTDASVRLVATGFFSSGGGRYLANTNLPDFIVNQDASMTLVTTASYLVGTEIQAGRKTGLYGYYSEAHADRPSPATSTAARSDLVCPARRRRMNGSSRRRQASPILSFATRRSAACSSWCSTPTCGARPSGYPRAHRPTRLST